MKVSNTVAVFVLLLAGLTWFFDKELKRKRDRCVDFCANYEAPRNANESAVSADQSLGNNPDSSNPHEMKYFQCGCDAIGKHL